MLLKTAGPMPKEGLTNIFCSKDQDEKVEKELMFEADFSSYHMSGVTSE